LRGYRVRDERSAQGADAGGAWTSTPGEIFQQIIPSWKFPNDVFAGSPAAVQPIQQMIGRQFQAY